MRPYDVTRVEKGKAEVIVINFSVQKRAKNREKSTSGDYNERVLLIMGHPQLM